MKELKNILVATDFSKKPYNALAYAIKIEKICNANMSLLHAYRLIPCSPASGEAHLLKKRLEEEIQHQFKKMFSDLMKNTDTKLVIDCISKIGFLEDVIESYIHTETVDLVVMGTSGISNSNKTFVSTFSAVATTTDLLVLAIPRTISFQKWNRIFLTKENKNSSEMIPYLISKFDSTFDTTNLSDTDFKNFVPDSTTAKPIDILSIQPEEYVFLEKQIGQQSSFSTTDEWGIPLLMA